MTSPWQNFTASIRSVFFNPTLRFSLLRIICVSTFVLICNVPMDDVTISTRLCIPQNLFPALDNIVSKYKLQRMIYSYCLCAFTLLHHVPSAFGPKLSLPGIVDFPLIVGEIILFMFQAATGRWAVLIPCLNGYANIDFDVFCECSFTGTAIVVALFTWAILISLLLLAIMRIAEALESNGRYIWTRYDITGLNLMPRRAQAASTVTEKRPNGVQVLTGMRLWEAHFKGEGNSIVLPRGIIAFIFVALVLVFTFTAVVLDPMHEADEVPVRIGMSRHPLDKWYLSDVNVVVGLAAFARDEINFNISQAVSVSNPFGNCVQFSSQNYLSIGQSDFVFSFINVQCEKNSPTVSVHVNFTAIEQSSFDLGLRPVPVQVMIGHSNGTDISSAIIHRTEAPVLLIPGMNILGFAHQHKVRLFRNPGLSTFGFFAPSDEFVLSEITNIQPNYQEPPSSNDTASLLIIPWTGFSDIKVIQDYRDKSVLKGLSSVGGLWTFLGFIFGALFGSPLVRVAFGAKPLSIFGLVHNFGTEKTQRKYQKTYPLLASDMETLRANPGLMALLLNHLVDLDVLLPDADPKLPNDLENHPRSDKPVVVTNDNPLSEMADTPPQHP